MIPKFRGWHEQGFMLKVENIVRLNLEDDILEYCVLNEYGDRSDRECYFNEIELMQSTGLHDKNGKEIFEGDIVENTTQTVYLGHKFEVVWNKNYAVYQLMNNGLGSNIPLTQDFMSYEVIGNIYENKDLLGVENE